MRIWLMKDGENLPIQLGSRPMRTGMLAESLCARGHDVSWWTSTFSHQRKELLFNKDTSCEITPRFKLRLLHAGEYHKNISLRRYYHHYKLGKKFSRVAEAEDPPDIILCSFPTINFAQHSMLYARRHKIPIILDMRDFWPDIYIDRMPPYLKSISRLALAHDFRKNYEVFSRADGLVGVTQGVLNWALRYAGRSQQSCDRVFQIGFPDKILPDDTSGDTNQKTLNLPSGKIIFVFIGTFGSSYDLISVCRTAKHLYDEGFNDAHFVLAGDGDQRAFLEKLARELPNVTLTGWLNRHELQRLMTNADVGIAPCISKPDSMPNKIYEYLAGGLPILTSLEGEAADLIVGEQLGFTYEVGDFNTLAKQVKKLTVDESLRESMSKRSRSIFEERFRAEEIYTEYAKYLEDRQAEFSSRPDDN